MKKQILLIGNVCTAVLLACNHGPSPSSQNDTTQIANPINEHSKVLTSMPEDFPGKAAIGGMMEVESSARMIKYTENPDIQNLATIMVRDHLAANNELAVLAKKQGIELPKTLTSEKIAILKKIDSIGDEYEKNKFYANLMVSEHQTAVSLFSAATSNSNKELAAFATKQLPILKHHLMEAQNVQQITNSIKNDKGDKPLKISKSNQ